MGLWLVPCGIQHLSLTSSQSCSTPSFNRLLCAALPHQTPCPAWQIQHPLLWAALPHPKTPAKCSLPSRATRQLFLQQVRKQRRRKGGERGQAEPSRRDAPSTCRATCHFDGGWTASASSRQAAVGKGGNSAPEILVEKESPHLEPRTTSRIPPIGPASRSPLWPLIRL